MKIFKIPPQLFTFADSSIPIGDFNNERSRIMRRKGFLYAYNTPKDLRKLVRP